jgi:hypothetical protein
MEVNYRQIYKADWLKLLPILGLAFYISFIPHLNYPYPLHADEWVLMTNSKAMISAQSAIFLDPFLGNATITLSTNLEAGYQLFLVYIQQTTGIAWETLFFFFPSIISMITVLSVYILAKRHNFGWEAALLTAIIPTSVGILGPAFLVPVALGLTFIPLSLFIVFHYKSWVAYLILFIFNVFLLAIHAPSAICLFIILIPYIFLNLKGNLKHSMGIIVALMAPFFAVFPWIFDLLLPTAKSLLQPVAVENFQWWTTYTTLPQIITRYGYIPSALCLLGVFILYLKGGREKLGLALALLALLAMLSVFFTFHYGVWIIYLRGLVFALLMTGVVAGAGLMAIKNLKLSGRIAGFSVPHPVRNIGYLLCLVLVIATLAISVPARQDAAYYHMIDQEDYRAFKWVNENIPTGLSGKVVLDPWKATAFTALTGKSTFTRIHATVQPSDSEAQAFLNSGCSDKAFLEKHGISLVYTRSPVSNQDLIEVRPNVFLLTK